ELKLSDAHRVPVLHSRLTQGLVDSQTSKEPLQIPHCRFVLEVKALHVPFEPLTFHDGPFPVAHTTKVVKVTPFPGPTSLLAVLHSILALGFGILRLLRHLPRSLSGLYYKLPRCVNQLLRPLTRRRGDRIDRYAPPLSICLDCRQVTLG